MNTTYKEAAIQKIVEMPKEGVSKVLIFMAGMEAERSIEPKNEAIAHKKSNSIRR